MNGERSPRSLSRPRRATPPALRLAIAALLLAAIVYIGYSAANTAKVHVRVCVAYHGQSACREAAGRDRDEALRAAHDNACSQITSGVTGTIGCQDTAATSIRWLPN